MQFDRCSFNFQHISYKMRWNARSWCMIRPMRPLHSLVTIEKFGGIKRLSLSMQLAGCYTFLSYAYSWLVHLQKNAMLNHCPKWHSQITIRPVSNGNNGPLHPFPNPNVALASSTGACQEKRETLQEPNEVWWAWKHQTRPPPLKKYPRQMMNAEVSCGPSKTDSVPPVLGNNYREGGSSLNPNMQRWCACATLALPPR